MTPDSNVLTDPASPRLLADAEAGTAWRTDTVLARWETDENGTTAIVDIDSQIAALARPEGTSVAVPCPAIRREMTALCRAAREEHFEDGVETSFSRQLVRLIGAYGEEAVEALAEIIRLREIGEDVSSEALRWLGLMERTTSYRRRRRLLEDCLFSPSPGIRDGAVLGLSFMDDQHAIPYIETALEIEDRDWLRRTMEQVIADLREG